MRALVGGVTVPKTTNSSSATLTHPVVWSWVLTSYLPVREIER